MLISFFVGLLFVLGTCWNTTLFAQTETEPATVGFVGSLSEATAVAKEKEMNFFIVVWEDDQNPAYLNTISLLNDSSVIQAFDGKILPLIAHSSSDNGLNMQKQFDLSEFPAALFVSIEGEELYTLENPEKLEADQLIDLYERFVIP